MIFSENEIIKYGQEKRVKFPPKKEIEKKQDHTPIFISYMSSIMTFLGDIKSGIAKMMEGFNDLDSRIDRAVRGAIPKPTPQKEPKPDKWDFKIIRDMDNRIQKIEAIRRK